LCTVREIGIVSPVFARSVAAAALALSACSLGLDFGVNGLPCADGGACLDGYVCRLGRCVDEADAGELVCTGEQPPATECDGATGLWKPACTGRACAPGKFCEKGECKPVVDGPGKPCSVDTDCGGAPLFCLAPLEAGGGVCTRTCTAGESCPSHATCRTLAATDGSSPKLCLPESFMNCPNEGACSPFSLSCTVLWGRVGANAIAVVGCGERIVGGRAVGDACSITEPCANRLCVTPGSGQGFCTTPCRSIDDCGTAGIAGGCGPVRLDSQVLPQLCLAGPPTFCKACVTPGNCGPDGPVCMEGRNACSYRCANSFDCVLPATCQMVGSQQYCVTSTGCP
jgi:hypothetical protein